MSDHAIALVALAIAAATFLVDVGILSWLVWTWFREGHHLIAAMGPKRPKKP